MSRRRLTGEIARFLAVGGAAFLIEAGLATVLVFGLPGLLPAALPSLPLLARAIATVVAMAAAWLGNRLLTYRGASAISPSSSILRFLAANAIALVIGLVPLGFGWHVLGLRDPVSFTVLGTVLGTALAMAYRFHACRTWVFTTRAERLAPARTPGGAHV